VNDGAGVPWPRRPRRDKSWIVKRFLTLLVAFSSLACSKGIVPANGHGGATTTTASGGGGSDGGAYTGPANWNRPVTPPSDADAAAGRAACTYKAGQLPAETQGVSAPNGTAIPVDHILIIIKENRSFDHYFSQLPAYGQPDVEVAPAGYTNPDGMGGTVAPYHDNLYCLVDTDHEWAGSHTEYDNGAMDGFFSANDNWGTAPPHPPNASMTSGARALAYYDQTDIPFYYWLANEFSIADHYHCSLLGPTWPNRMYAYAATSRGNVSTNLTDFHDQKGACTTDADCGGAPGSCFNNTACKGTCQVDSDCGLDAQEGACDVADGGVCATVGRTVFDYMEQRHLNWKVYAAGTPGWAVITDTWLQYQAAHQFTMDDLLNDAKAGTLPDVAYIDPDLGNEGYSGQDEHPEGMPQTGQNWTASVLNAIAQSPAWPRTALFFTYDEHGGFWDHVPPPPACPPDSIAPMLAPTDPPGGFDRYGVRVPMIVFSPFAKKHYVSHDTYDHTSILRFIEARFVMPAITNRDANALAPWDMFDFTGVPHATPPTITVPPIDQAGLDACMAIYTQ
jgi:phospholipase C